MIKLENVSFKYDNKINLLNNINLEIETGEKIVLIGENSYKGKSVFFRLLTGLEKCNTGNIYIDYNNIKNLDYSKDISMGYLPQKMLFFENKTVYQNLEYIFQIRKEFDNYDNKIINALKDFDIINLKDLKLKKLTGFQRILVSLCRIYLRNIDFILIENILDYLTNEEILLITQKINLFYNKNKNLTVIIDTNNEFVINSLRYKELKFDLGNIIKS